MGKNVIYHKNYNNSDGYVENTAIQEINPAIEERNPSIEERNPSIQSEKLSIEKIKKVSLQVLLMILFMKKRFHRKSRD